MNTLQNMNGQGMRNFMDENFLLSNSISQELYHDHAKQLPIIDYHCHLPPAEIANNHQFKNITQAWLYGDHYKWRAMRANGIPEEFCTGNASDHDKFKNWAATVPYTLRNPLFHWTHLELQRYFDIQELLNERSADAIYAECNEKMSSEQYSVKNLLRKMNVKLVCTTDDPLDELTAHQQCKTDGFEIHVLPAFRPDASMNIEKGEAFTKYVDKLGVTANVSISSLQSFLDALKQRHDYFAANGCTVADHGMSELFVVEFTEKEIESIFEKARANKALTENEIRQFKSFMIIFFGRLHHEKGWVQQFHLGAFRSINSRMLKKLGPDTGWDSVGDYSLGTGLAKFLDTLDSTDQLTKTILYNLNPADNEMMATMIGNFNDGTIAGKMQWGSGWWFLDQKDGMTRQLNALSNMGLVSRFVGMLTDSRSFLSFPRHEYFRRILCDLFGTEIANGELPNDIPWTAKVIESICYYNARSYFGWEAKLPLD